MTAKTSPKIPAPPSPLTADVVEAVRALRDRLDARETNLNVIVEPGGPTRQIVKRGEDGRIAEVETVAA